MPTIRRARPSTSLPATHTAKRSSASPVTPPRPAGSGQAAVRGRQAAKLAASTHGGDPGEQPQPLAMQRAGGSPAASPRPRSAAPARPTAMPNSCISRSATMAPPTAEQVAHRRVGGVAERGILRRPGRQRGGQQHRQHDQGDAGQLAHAPAQRVAQAVGETEAFETAVDGRHACDPQPSVATRRCSASAVVSRSCTMATRI